jgi:hypothetical protein
MVVFVKGTQLTNIMSNKTIFFWWQKKSKFLNDSRIMLELQTSEKVIKDNVVIKVPLEKFFGGWLKVNLKKIMTMLFSSIAHTSTHQKKKKMPAKCRSIQNVFAMLQGHIKNGWKWCETESNFKAVLSMYNHFCCCVLRQWMTRWYPEKNELTDSHTIFIYM